MNNQKTLGTLVKLFYTGLSRIYDESEVRAITGMYFSGRLGMNSADLIINSDNEISDSQWNSSLEELESLINFKPVQYVLNSCEFFSREFYVNEFVLIPRPETEELVEWIIDELKQIDNPRILDIGTGSGCIAVSLASSLSSDVYATDISQEALEVCEKNAELNRVLVQTMHHDILQDDLNLTDLDVIVSNPPYIPISERESMEKNVVDYEPELALFTEEDSLVFYKRIAEQGLNMLKEGGRLFFEIHYQKSSEVGEILFDLEYAGIEIRKDISGNDRMIKAVKQKTRH